MDLLYGDFTRAHGRKGATFENLCKWLPKKIDALLLEGTMLNRSNAKYPSECSVEQGMSKAIRREAGLVCLNCSAQNIDRMVTAFRACKRSSRIFVTDIYSAWILRQAQTLSRHIPDITWKNVRVLEPKGPAARQYQIIKNNMAFFGEFYREIYSPNTLIALGEVLTNPARYMIKVNDYYMTYILDQMGGDGATIIYSQWAGYLKEGTTYYNKRMAAIESRNDTRFEMIHTSGHAIPRDLKALAEAGSVSTRGVIGDKASRP